MKLGVSRAGRAIDDHHITHTYNVNHTVHKHTIPATRACTPSSAVHGYPPSTLIRSPPSSPHPLLPSSFLPPSRVLREISSKLHETGPEETCLA